jgi:hypothetical protein
LLQPYVEVEGEKDELKQQLLWGLVLCQIAMDLILLGTMMSRMVLPTNSVGELNIIFSLLSPLLIILGGCSPFLSVGIFLLIPLILSSKLLRILQLHGLH